MIDVDLKRGDWIVHDNGSYNVVLDVWFDDVMKKCRVTCRNINFYYTEDAIDITEIDDDVYLFEHCTKVTNPKVLDMIKFVLEDEEIQNRYDVLRGLITYNKVNYG